VLVKQVVRFALLFVFAAVSIQAQTNLDALTNRPAAISNSPAETFQIQTNQDFSFAQRVEEIRMACIEGRRSICGKILKVLPDGLVVDSGYTNLLRAPLNRSWLAPGTVSATRASNVIEGNEPNSICIGLVFLTDLPKSHGAKPKPKLYDYVLIVGYPAGQYTYTSVGNVQRTVRKFSASLNAAVNWKLNNSEK
jgi:hypothetical protein